MATNAGALVPSDPTNVGQGSTALATAAGNLSSTGASLVNEGQGGLSGVFTQLSQLVSGNASAVNEAIRPQATSVLKQYDTARATAARTAQRGGGQASTNEQSYLSEGQDLSNLKSTAITNARSQLGQLAAQVLGLGVQSQVAGQQGFSDLLTSALQGKQMNNSEWASIGSGIGTAAMIALAFL